MKRIRFSLAAMGALAAAPAYGQEASEPPVATGGRYVVDAVSVDQGEDSRFFVLHDVELTAEADLQKLIGAKGLSAGAHFLANFGGKPNDGAGTLQGINNIEVGVARAKLYEAWVQQAFADGRASLRLGLTDLNADFYQNDSAGLLIAPPFGIGSELAATGPNGPSIFPSTALTARLSVDVGAHGYARAAVVDAKSGVLGDPTGIDFRFRDGVLLIGEAGTTKGGKLALGVWRYSQRQDDIRAITASGDPVQRLAQGVYLLVDQQIAGDDKAGTHLFARIGFSEGKTTPFRGGFQAGLLIAGLIPGRPDGQLSLGVEHGLLSHGFRDNLIDQAFATDDGETGVEITYQDKIAPFLSIQPDIQYIRRSYSDGHGRNTLVTGLRMIASFGGD
jgi:porin